MRTYHSLLIDMRIKKTQALNKLRELNSRTKIVRGGTSAGKTICILAILIDYAIMNEGKEISVVSESIPHLRRGAYKDFLNILKGLNRYKDCLLYTSPSPRDGLLSRMPSSA